MFRLARWFFMRTIRYVFLISVTISWFAFLLGTYLVGGLLLRQALEATFPWLSLIVGPVGVVLGFLLASLFTVLYYVVGRKILLLMGMWNEDLAEASFEEVRQGRHKRLSMQERRRRRRRRRRQRRAEE